MTTEVLSYDPANRGNRSFNGDAQAVAIVGDPFNMTTTLVFGQQIEGGSDVNSRIDTAPAPIPLPAAGLMLLGGLGGLAALRRRRKAA